MSWGQSLNDTNLARRLILNAMEAGVLVIVLASVAALADHV